MKTKRTTKQGKLPKKRTSEEKWGKGVMSLGFCVIPSLLFQAQQRLGLNAAQLVVLLQIADHWWHQERVPFPSVATIGERAGLSTRQTRRHIADLQKAGLLNRIERSASNKGRLSNAYDLGGLVARLQRLEPDFREAREARKRVMRRGGLAKA